MITLSHLASERRNVYRRIAITNHIKFQWCAIKICVQGFVSIVIIPSGGLVRLRRKLLTSHGGKERDKPKGANPSTLSELIRREATPDGTKNSAAGTFVPTRIRLGWKLPQGTSNGTKNSAVLILDFFRHADRPQLFGVRFFCKKKIMERRRS